MKEKIIQVERNFKGQLVIGDMRVEHGIDTWVYAILPADINTRAKIEALIAKTAQGRPYRITYTDELDDLP